MNRVTSSFGVSPLSHLTIEGRMVSNPEVTGLQLEADSCRNIAISPVTLWLDYEVSPNLLYSPGAQPILLSPA